MAFEIVVEHNASGRLVVRKTARSEPDVPLLRREAAALEALAGAGVVAMVGTELLEAQTACGPPAADPPGSGPARRAGGRAGDGEGASSEGRHEGGRLDEAQSGPGAGPAPLTGPYGPASLVGAVDAADGPNSDGLARHAPNDRAPGDAVLFDEGRGPRPSLELAYAGPDLDQAPALDGREAVAVVATLAVTLARAHAQGLSHGWVQPSHVLLSRDGPVLCSWGRAGWQAPPAASAAELGLSEPERYAPEEDVAQLGELLAALLSRPAPRARRWTGRLVTAHAERRDDHLRTRAAALATAARQPDPPRRPTMASFAEQLADLAASDVTPRSRQALPPAARARRAAPTHRPTARDAPQAESTPPVTVGPDRPALAAASLPGSSGSAGEPGATRGRQGMAHRRDRRPARQPQDRPIPRDTAGPLPKAEGHAMLDAGRLAPATTEGAVRRFARFGRQWPVLRDEDAHHAAGRAARHLAPRHLLVVAAVAALAGIAAAIGVTPFDAAPAASAPTGDASSASSAGPATPTAPSLSDAQADQRGTSGTTASPPSGAGPAVGAGAPPGSSDPLDHPAAATPSGQPAQPSGATSDGVGTARQPTPGERAQDTAAGGPTSRDRCPADADRLAVDGLPLGCASGGELATRRITVGSATLEIGRPGDVVVLAESSCDGFLHAVVLRPDGGGLWLFTSWAAPGVNASARLVSQVPGATGLATSARCGEVIVIDGDGTANTISTQEVAR